MTRRPAGEGQSRDGRQGERGGPAVLKRPGSGNGGIVMVKVGEWPGSAQGGQAVLQNGTRAEEGRSFADSMREKLGRDQGDARALGRAEENASQQSEESISRQADEYEEYRRQQRYLDKLEEERRLEYKRKKKREAQKRLLKEQMKKAILKKAMLKKDSERRMLNKVLVKRAAVGKENYREFLVKGVRGDRRTLPELPHISGVSAEEIFSMFI